MFISNQMVLEKLVELKYPRIAESYSKIFMNKQTNDLSFNEVMMLMLKYEDTQLINRKRLALLKETNLSVPSSLDDIEYNNDRNIDKSMINTLSTLDFIKHAHNVIITGATGCGKSFIGTSLGFKAIESIYKCTYYRLPLLLEDIALKRESGAYKKFLKKLKKQDLLIIDDLGVSNISVQDSREILEILEQRNYHHSTVLISQIPFSNWYEMFKDPTLADAIIDRISYNSFKIELKGESMRKIKNSLN